MNALKRFFAALAIAAAPLAASAHETGLSKPYAACMDKSGGVTMGMIECITAEHQRQDLLLNKAYKALMAGLPAPRKAQLQQAQRAWLNYRDANCAFYDDPGGGTLARVNANDCMMTATAERARELESFKP
jgi:uncharacterized protein YecT (DUF1311 family)